MKKIYTLLFFLLLSIHSVFSQIHYSRFSLKPQFSYGVALPSHESVVSGSESLTYTWKTTSIGQYIDGRGNIATSFKVTNRIGMQFNYLLNDMIEIGVGANRTNLVTKYKPSFIYELSNGNTFDNVSDYLTFYDFSANLNLYFGKTFFVIQPSFVPDIFANRRKAGDADANNISVNDFRNVNRTGVTFRSSKVNDTKYSIYLGFGRKSSLLTVNFEWQLGLSFNPTPLYTETATFYTNNILVGENDYKINTSAIFFTLNTPIKIKLFQPRISKPKQEKIRKTKPEKSKPVTKELKVEVGDRKIGKGENLVLDNIQFEQTKASLNGASMEDLDKVYEFLTKYPRSTIEITGHTSNEGNRSDNLELSTKRAEECKAYLLKKGIKSSRIKAFGLGPDRMISIADQNLNRRVEMKIIRID